MINTHVFSKRHTANGVVKDIRRDGYVKVQFTWGKYCEIRYGKWVNMRSHHKKWDWCNPEDLVELGFPPVPYNKVSMIGRRSLDRLFRMMVGIPYKRFEDGSDIVINYGTLVNAAQVTARQMVLNEHLVCNKYQQMKMVGEDICPVSTTERPEDINGWIIKPNHSIGGENIRRLTKGDSASYDEYYQKEFDKVREFRVHCFLWLDDPVPFVQEKAIHNKDQLCWNKKQGGSFRYLYQKDLEYGDFYGLDQDTLDKLRAMSIEALKKLKYDFGGLDFGMDSGGNLKLFEVNSRMGLRERSFYTYKKVFWELFELDAKAYKQRRWNIG